MRSCATFIFLSRIKYQPNASDALCVCVDISFELTCELCRHSRPPATPAWWRTLPRTRSRSPTSPSRHTRLCVSSHRKCLPIFDRRHSSINIRTEGKSALGGALLFVQYNTNENMLFAQLCMCSHERACVSLWPSASLADATHWPSASSLPNTAEYCARSSARKVCPSAVRTRVGACGAPVRACELAAAPLSELLALGQGRLRSRDHSFGRLFSRLSRCARSCAVQSKPAAFAHLRTNVRTPAPIHSMLALSHVQKASV